MNSITLALISYVSAFGLVTIHSGSQYQYSAVKLASNGRLSLNGEEDADFTLQDGKLTVNGKSIDVTGGRLIAGDSFSTVFGQDQSDLTWDGQNSFVVCPDINNEIAFAGQTGAPSDCTNPVGVALYISNGSGSSSGSSSAASSAETSAAATSAPASSAPATDAASTDVVEQTVTETVCTKESCTGVASANGAAKNGLFVGAAGVVAAALL